MCEKIPSFCQLCFDTTDKLTNIVSVNDQNIGIKRLIDKCFTFLDPLIVLTEICSRCWIKFEIFLEFCEKIRDIHENRNENIELVFVSNSNSGYDLIKTANKIPEEIITPTKLSTHEEMIRNGCNNDWEELNNGNTCWSSDSDAESVENVDRSSSLFDVNQDFDNNDGNLILKKIPLTSNFEKFYCNFRIRFD